MRRILLLALLFFMVLSKDYSIAEVWQDVTDGLSDRVFYAIAEGFNGNRAIYIGTSNALYKKSDCDKKWAQVFVCRGSYKGVNHICVDNGSIIYIATENGLYKSLNSGNSWKRLFRGIAQENNCTNVFVDPVDKKEIYLGTNKGLFYTIDEGRTWKRFHSVIGDSKIRSIAATDSQEATLRQAQGCPERSQGANYLYVICNNELYKVCKRSESSDRIFSSHIPEYLEEETDGKEISSEEDIFILNNITCRNNSLYLSTNRGLFISKDEGNTWRRFNSAGLSNRFINHTLLLDLDSNEILVATKEGVFRYIDQERQWRRIYAGMDSVNVKKLMLSQSSGYIWALCKDRIYKIKLAEYDNPHQEPLSTDRILSRFEDEPTIIEVQAMAIDYAEVHPHKIERWRRGAKFKALFPKIDFGIDHTWSDTYEIYTGSSKSYWLYGPHDRTEGWGLNFSWDLSDLIWNESQTSIDVRSKLMVQLRDDIVDEVTRIYFERRRLQIELLMDPPDDLHTILEKTLRLQELAAGIDGLTGGHFSTEIEKRSRRKKDR